MCLHLTECLSAQLDASHVTWDVVEAVKDANFDSTTSLTEGLWGAYKNKVSIHLAHLLLTSDVWRVSDDATTLSLWCDFVDANYPDRLMLLNSKEAFVQIPVGFRFCSQPFGRLLASLDGVSANKEEILNKPLHWLLDRIRNSPDEADLKEVRT